MLVKTRDRGLRENARGRSVRARAVFWAFKAVMFVFYIALRLYLVLFYLFRMG